MARNPTRKDIMLTLTSSTVLSPLGIRLCAGLLAPFLSPAGQEEVAERWGASAEDLLAEALEVNGALRDLPALHSALAVWSRTLVKPDAQNLLGNLLRALPVSSTEAQALLDGWARENTNDLITRAPVQVDASTESVIASALALDDKWASGPFQYTPVRFRTAGATSGEPAAGFAAQIRDASSTPDTIGVLGATSTVVARLGLSDLTVMTFGLSPDGPGKALIDLRTDAPLNDVGADHPLVGTVKARAGVRAVVELPEFTTRSTWDLLEQADLWGLANASDPAEGVPGLNDGEFLGQAAQSAMVEVSSTGVKAAAVTMAGTLRSALPPLTSDALRVTFDRPFAYRITRPGLPEALFEGIYGG